MSAGRAEDRDEGGFTLIELVIYTSLMVVVVTLVGAILITALTGQKDIAEASSGSTGGQLVAQNLANAARSAEAIQVCPTGDLVQVATPGRAAAAATEYVALYFSTENGGAVFIRKSPTPIADAPSGSDPSGWTKLAEGLVVSARSGAPAKILTGNGTPTNSISYEFAMSSGSGKPQLFASTVTSRQNTTAWGSSFCD